MTVLGRGLVFQPVLVTQTCTYNSNDIALQNIGITDFPSKKQKQKQNKTIFLKNIPIQKPALKKKKKKKQQKKP